MFSWFRGLLGWRAGFFMVRSSVVFFLFWVRMGWKVVKESLFFLGWSFRFMCSGYSCGFSSVFSRV